MSNRKLNRRQFVGSAAAAGAGFFIANQYAGAAPTRKTKVEKLSIACIGVGGRGHADISQMREENIIAVVDVDQRRAADAFNQFPNAKRYADFREMYDKHGKELDAVVVATPDHMHAPASVMGMKLGLHCYCEKPLTWSIEEARTMRKLAEENGLATQMGNQAGGNAGLRNAVQLLWDGVLGEVSEVHIWTNRPIWPQAVEVPAEEMPVPDTLDWNLWLGCAKRRPYHKSYLPFNWRGWYDWGTGALGDMACHFMFLAFLGLRLGYPTRVSAETSPLFTASYPARSKVTYEFPAREGLKPVMLTWYDGKQGPPAGVTEGMEIGDNGQIFIGSEGTMYAASSGESHTLYPQEKFKDLARPKSSLGYVPGHHWEWRMACRGETTPISNFSRAALLTEIVLLGDLAVRTGKPIEWDPENMKAIGVPEADALIRRQYENGFGL